MFVGLIDFLASKDITIESNPNTKIDAGTYGILQAEFQSEISAREESQKVSIGTEKETITIEQVQGVVPEKEEEFVPEPVVEKVEEEVAEAEPVAEEVVVEEPVAEEPVVEEPVVEKPVSKEPIIVEPKEGVNDDDGDLKVLGTIDLGKINLKTRPSKKKPVKEEKVVEEKKEVKKEKAAPVEKEEVKAKDKVEVRKVPEEIETKYEKLAAPKVLGKIELPKKVKKPVASSSGGVDPKKKRKRIVRKVDVATEKRKPFVNMQSEEDNPDDSTTAELNQQVED